MRRGKRPAVAIVLGVMMVSIVAVLPGNSTQQNAVGAIVVAAEPLGFGARLTDDNVKEIPWPAASLPDGAFATKEQLLKDGPRLLLKPLANGEPVLRGRVTGPDPQATMSPSLEEGRKAVTIRVDDIRVAFVDYVDVVLMRKEGPDSFSDILVHYVKVQHTKLAVIDQLLNERQEPADLAKAMTLLATNKLDKLAMAVTLHVTTEQAQEILLASTVGRLSLIPLRRSGDDVRRIRTFMSGSCPRDRPFCR